MKAKAWLAVVTMVATAALLIALTGCSGSDNGSTTPDDPGNGSENPTPGVGGPAAAREGSEAGVLVHNGERMVVKSAVAVWNPAEGELDVELLPFELSDADVARCQKQETFFMLDGKQAEGFTDRVPYATYSLSWWNNTASRGDMTKAHNALHAHFIRDAQSNLSLNFPASQHDVQLEGKLEAGGTLRLVAKGRDASLGDHDMSWDLALDAPIVLAQ